MNELARFIADHHGDTYGPTQDDGAAWATFKDRERQREIHKVRFFYYHGDDQTREAIRAVILRLPYEVQQFVFRYCHFFIMDHAAFTFPSSLLGGRHAIVLSAGVPADLFAEIVAHEIAHCYSGKFGDGETDVCELAARWGFSSDGRTRYLKRFVYTTVTEAHHLLGVIRAENSEAAEAEASARTEAEHPAEQLHSLLIREI